ncbi:hypothetical protein [Streptomyces sp. NPDC003943]
MTINPRHLPLLEEVQRIAPKGVKVEYTRTDRKFGETIRIPEPFGFDLDLSPLSPYH